MPSITTGSIISKLVISNNSIYYANITIFRKISIESAYNSILTKNDFIKKDGYSSQASIGSLGGFTFDEPSKSFIFVDKLFYCIRRVNLTGYTTTISG